MEIIRREAVPIILEVLQQGAETTVALMGAMAADRAESRRRLHRLGRYGVPSFKVDWAESYRARQQFVKLLNRLKREGLISNDGRRRNVLWQLTAKGLARLQRLLKIAETPKPVYPKRRDGKWRVVVYDIPEREREKRVWIRQALVSLGFSFLQESVWVGTCAISRAFLDDLREMEMIPYVQIFEVSRKGTVESVR